jgi:hypothetical protein
VAQLGSVVDKCNLFLVSGIVSASSGQPASGTLPSDLHCPTILYLVLLIVRIQNPLLPMRSWRCCHW